MTIRLVVLVTLATVAACERPGSDRTEREVVGEALKGLVTYPRSSLVSVSAGRDAAQLVLSAPAPAETVAAWYRRTLRRNGWELRADGMQPDGSISLYADSGRRSVWITFAPGAAGAATTYTLVGDIPGLDTARQRSGSSMSSKRIQRR